MVIFYKLISKKSSSLPISELIDRTFFMCVTIQKVSFEIRESWRVCECVCVGLCVGLFDHDKDISGGKYLYEKPHPGTSEGS